MRMSVDVQRIPTGFRRKAQGCAARATLGNRIKNAINPNGVAAWFRAHRTQPRWGCGLFIIVTQGSRVAATLDFGTESRWDSQSEREVMP